MVWGRTCTRTEGETLTLTDESKTTQCATTGLPVSHLSWGWGGGGGWRGRLLAQRCPHPQWIQSRGSMWEIASEWRRAGLPVNLERMGPKPQPTLLSPASPELEKAKYLDESQEMSPGPSPPGAHFLVHQPVPLEALARKWSLSAFQYGK